MKKLLVASVFIGLALSFTSSLQAQSLITISDCEHWRELLSTKMTQDLEKVNSTLLQDLHRTQQNTKTWVGYSKVDEMDWDIISYVGEEKNKITVTTLDEDEIVITDKWDMEYFRVAYSCALAVAQQGNIDLSDSYLRKAELHAQNAINELKRVHTEKRMPFIHHGGILPGATEKGEASDYVENQLIPKFVNGVLVMLISLSVLMLIIGGVMFLVAGGDSDSTARAKTIVMWSIVGVVITILSYSIVQFIIGIDFSL